ncbi:unnamed protein product [Linum tenue]|uniref:Uncharacterized protein n=2 Tax=Linum tenue TaxID=586396 RepID=A0AAV0PCP8_9ROSI|nr:unnamed protein product [Linum tenue]
MMMERHTKTLAEARARFKQIEELVEVDGDSTKTLVMIDALQRLGLDHHFEEEIDKVLKREEGKEAMKFSVFDNDSSTRCRDLLETSLRFRLLRHQGYRIPSDVFEKFRNKEGKFESNMGCSNNIMGMMELYEASYWATKGESILDEAREFSTHMLELYSTHQRLASYTLRHPIHRSLPKFNVKSYLGISHGGSTKHSDEEDILIDLARLDFNVNQSMHQQEVVQISTWWKELGLAEELTHARNEPVKWYMWPLAISTDPKLSEERVELAKPISLVYLIDDIFDVYGSLDELTHFTDAVDRWDVTSANQLPDYMRKCFIALHEVTNQIGYNVYKRHGWNPIPSLQQAWARLFKAFLVEAKWFKTGELPSTEEYLKNGIVSSGVQLVLVHLFFILGRGLTQRNVELIGGENPPVISSVAKILRLWDDLSATDEEHSTGNDGSYLDCYVKENPGSSIHGAREHVMEMIEETWKQLNNESLSPTTPFPLAFNRAAHNLAKMVALMYGCNEVVDQNQSAPRLKDHIRSILFESFP